MGLNLTVFWFRTELIRLLITFRRNTWIKNHVEKKKVFLYHTACVMSKTVNVC